VCTLCGIQLPSGQYPIFIRIVSAYQFIYFKRDGNPYCSAEHAQ
jgi:hypothetical protein